MPERAFNLPNCKCSEASPTTWVAVWPGVLRCAWCGALLQVSSGRIVECGDFLRPVVGGPLVEVSPEEVGDALCLGREESRAVGVVRPEGWVYP